MALTSKDVAERAGVSRSTVSYILNGQGHRFSPATREAVERAVAELGYQPQAAGRALVRGQSDLVLFVLPLAAGAVVFDSVNILTDALAEKGISLLMRSASSSLASFRSMVTTVRPRAVIASSALSEPEGALLQSLGIPTIDLARASSEPGGWNWDIGRMQAEHLMQRGYQRLAYARLEEAGDDVLMGIREQGVREACRAAGLPYPEAITVALRADADLDAVRALPPDTGVACYNDHTAAAVLAAARVVGRRVPSQDLGVIGVDNSPIATQTAPRLTTIGYELQRPMRRLAELIADDATEAAAEAGSVSRTRIESVAYLVQGDST
ncbi:LacI family DNA-binding transcriptional regulator [Streptomyces sp. NPDC020794]|uniref:LacI family DNA-binding transcriptional regulator n=1 Tax=unclassified Streptomyces TaxID=2593676 RepID=UPI0036E6C9EB